VEDVSPSSDLPRSASLKTGDEIPNSPRSIAGEALAGRVDPVERALRELVVVHRPEQREERWPEYEHDGGGGADAQEDVGSRAGERRGDRPEGPRPLRSG
jgi:hypothetical protein